MRQYPHLKSQCWVAPLNVVLVSGIDFGTSYLKFSKTIVVHQIYDEVVV